MIKFSKESQITFFCLLTVPILWSSLNYFGFLDYLKTKSVDWRMQMRGEIPQSSYITEEKILVDGNLSIPKIPKITYVNFDAATLAMDDVGERPWDRAFFRDMALALIERGNARVLAFDFGFTPKSMSKMVPQENSFRSDMAMGELVAKYPNRVVLGCLYSGVPTPFVKSVNSSAFPPLFKDGYSWTSSLKSEKYNYPESPTYPLINFINGEHIGRLGSFTVPPFRAVDEIPRWTPLWFPSGGKSHAYNLLGGKQSKLVFELPEENFDMINNLKTELQFLEFNRSNLQAEIVKSAAEMASLNHERAQISEKLSKVESHKNTAEEAENVIKNFSLTIKANPSLTELISLQINKKEKEINSIFNPYLQNPESNSTGRLEEIKSEQSDLRESLNNLKLAMEANAALAAVIEPQIALKEKRLEEIDKVLKRENLVVTKPLSVQEKKQALKNISEVIEDSNARLENLNSKISATGLQLASRNQKKSSLDSSIDRLKKRLDQLNGNFPTELIEKNNSLLLVYASDDDSSDSEMILVDSAPNKVPLNYDKSFFTLGLEALLTYYGLDQESVEISSDYKNFKIVDPDKDILVQCDLVEGQFLEVNWFSKWTELQDEEELLRKAKKHYGDGEYKLYLKQIPPLFDSLIKRANLEKSNEDSSDPIKAIAELGVNEEMVEIAKKLLGAKPDDPDLPSFENLSQVVNGISYYFVSPKLQSDFNPMCGMKDILENARFQDEVEESISQLETKISGLQGPNFMGKILKALEQNPENPDLLAKRDQVADAISINRSNLASQRDELARINKFFSFFNNAIVLVGPEEKTFQDLAPTPFDKATVPKVSVHGNLIKTLITGRYLKRLPDSIDYIATFVVCIIMAGLAVYQGSRASLVQACGIILLAGYVCLAFFTFSESHVIWPITTPACAGLSTSFLGLAAMVVIEQKAKGKLKGMFGSYVSSDLVDQMVDSGEEPKLGGEETAITAFFSDVQAFSSFSELLTPTGLVDLMNEYLTAMTNILQEERGTLDKYIGDAIVAMYGAPIPMSDHAYQAVRTAILMQQKQIELREKWVPEVEKWGKCHGLVTQMQTRIGCNTGTATVGNMGALDRFNYTMMGDMVNLAARCESGAKAYGAYIMITEETKIASEKIKDDIAFRYLDKIVVKGRSQPVAMYEPTGFMNEINRETQDCLHCFSQGIEKYLKQDWKGALKLFEQAKGLEPNKPGTTPGVKDNPSMILIDRCKIMQENPPGDDWDGVYVMTTK